MSQSTDNMLPENAEPTTGSVTMPLGLTIVFALVTYVGCNITDSADGGFSALVYAPYTDEAEISATQAKTPKELQIERGAALYKQNCSNCHQPSGGGSQGQGAPPLAGSEWVLAEGPERIIRIVNNGLTGPIEVLGQTWSSGAMTPVGAAMSDKQVADVITYIRNAWGNAAGLVTPEQVKAVREETAGRGTKAWTADELLQVELGGE
ncbi:MAG: hypothetical protein CMO74_14850 [Verrucomicrobiales bacterium]|nr:hypothetical protein [Verrucomicrobiales bacterium]|tara:strand:- start:1766 stop:2386 length:621 start_codon:yes stop_codon:yes gene_type:complete